MSRPVLVADRSPVIEHVVEQAAQVGVAVEVVPDVGALRAGPSDLVLVDLDLLRRAPQGPVCPGASRVLALCLSAGGGAAPESAWAAAVRRGASDVLVLPVDDERLQAALVDTPLPPVTATVVAVVGATGGAGASTAAAVVATAGRAAGSRSVLVDLDPWGGGIDLLVGCEDAPGVRWADLRATSSRVSCESLVAALPRGADVPVLAWGRGEADIPDEAVRLVLDGVTRGVDVVVVDAGRGGDPADRALRTADHVVVVAQPRVRSVAAAGRVLARLPSSSDVRLVVRSGGPSCLVDPLDLADALQLPLAGVMPFDRHRAEHEEYGIAPASGRRDRLARWGTELLRSLDGVA